MDDRTEEKEKEEEKQKVTLAHVFDVHNNPSPDKHANVAEVT